MGVLLLAAGNAVAPDPWTPPIWGERSEGQRAPVVAVVKLLATPDQFEGRLVEVRGFLVATKTECAVYLSKEAADHGLRENALWIELLPDFSNKFVDKVRVLNGAMVRAGGVFSSKATGPEDAYGGGLTRAGIAALAVAPQKSARPAE